MEQNVQEQIATRLIVIETMLSFLLAREAAHNNVNLEPIHSAMISAISGSVTNATGRGDLSARIEQHIDSIYSMASVFLAQMPTGPHQK